MKKNPNSHPHQTLHSVGKMKKDLAAPGKARAPAVCIYIYISLHMWHMCSIVDWALMLDPMTKQVENMDSALHPLNVWPINVFSHWKTEYLNHLTVNSSSFIITKPLTQEPMISPWCFLSLEASGGWSLCWADQHCHPVGLWPSASKLRKQKQLGFYWIIWRFQA